MPRFTKRFSHWFGSEKYSDLPLPSYGPPSPHTCDMPAPRYDFEGLCLHHSIVYSQINSEKVYLSVEPSEVRFTAELGKQFTCPLQLLNTTDRFVVFEVISSDVKKYCVRPDSGIISPRSYLDISVTMQADKEFPEVMQCNDKFLLQSATTSSGNTDFFTVFRDLGFSAQSCILKVVYVSPLQPPSPIAEKSEEGSSPSTPVSYDGNSNTSDLTSIPKEDEEPKKQYSEIKKNHSHQQSNARSESIENYLTVEPSEVRFPDYIGLSRVDDWDNFKDEKQQNSSNDPIPPSTSYQPKPISDIPGHPVEVGEKLKGVKISKEGGTANIKSNATFLGELERNTPKRFSHEELMKCTSGFADKVGRGGFGSVYRGKFLNGTEIVVKVLEENDFVEETFQAEVSTMFKTCHRYLVKCYGYCFDPTMKALVYEYMENGSLDALLYGNPRKLEWKKFYKIAIKTAKGLSYLHDGCDNQIIHHDLKPTNVLLDKHFCVKITDFGVARIMNNNEDHVTWTKLRGTPGYIAPEMFMPASEITYKCDVYSFGMMLFEVLGMRRNGGGLDWFPKQVWSKFESGELDQIVNDSGIHKDKYRLRARVLSVVALWCVQFTPQARPSMSTVVKMLEGEIQVTEPPNPFFPAPESSYSKFSASPSLDKKRK